VGKGSGSSTTTGYRYYMSILMGLADSLDDIVQIKVGSMVAWSGPLSNDGAAVAVQLTQGSLFGGDKGEGGVVGYFDFYDGKPEQLIRQVVKDTIMNGNEVAVATADGSALIAFPPVDKNADSSVNAGAPTTGNPNIPITYVKQTVAVSEFRYAATLWFDGQICSNNPYPKEWKVRGRRTNGGWDGDVWYPAKVQIPLQDTEALAEASTDAGAGTATQAASTNSSPMSTALLLPDQGRIRAMNPAHIIYECLTNRNWGRGLSRALIDEPSFTSAANWLYSEGFGLCLKWSKSDDLSSFIQGVIDTIGASLYTDRSSGLMVLKLIRNDYSVSDLTTFDYNSGLIEIDDADTTAATALTNEVIVVWHSPISDTDRKVRAQNLASIQALNCTNSSTKTYAGIPIAGLAQRVAQRDLQASAYGIRSFNLKFDRRGFKIMPGTVFIINAPDRNIGNIILRCVAFNDGTLDDGVISLTASQDVFGLPSTTYTSVQQSQYNPTNKNPQPVTYARLVEATYRDVLTNIGADNTAALDATQTMIANLALAPTVLSTSYEMFTQATGETSPFDGGIVGFTIFAQLGQALGRYDTQMYMTSVQDVTDFVFPFCALVDDEFIRVDDYNTVTGLCNIARGCVDSIPAEHAAGAVVWDYDTAATDGREYVVGEVVTVQEQTITSAGYLDLSYASSHQIGTVGRQNRPYPPGNVKINGGYATDTTTISAHDLVISWAVRNRLFIQDKLYGSDLATQTPEAGQTTTVRIRSMKTGFVLDEIGGITGTTLTYAQARAIGAGAVGSVQIEVYSVRDGQTSIFANICPMNYYPGSTAPGVDVGRGAGGFGLQSVLTGFTGVSSETIAGFRLMPAATAESIATASMSSGFGLKDAGQGPAAPGGYATLGIFSLATATVASVGSMASGLALSAAQESSTATGVMTGGFGISAVEGAAGGLAAGQLAGFQLSSTATGSIIAVAVGFTAFQLTSSDTAQAAAQSTMNSVFAFSSVESS